MCISYNDVLKRLIEEKKMSNKADAEEKMTVCDFSMMWAAFMELTNIQATLFGAYEQVAPLAGEFSENYEGEAKDEVALFLEKLPVHIYKLSLFYGKMAQFVIATIMSFASNDQAMAEKLEG